jgi:hypothetical protein
VTDTPASTDKQSGSGLVAQSRESAVQVRQDAASMRETATELSAMVVAYAKQETLDPIKQLGRYVLFGVVGAIFMGLGGFFLALAAVRALQTELFPHLAHDLSWVPYMAGVLVAALGAVFAVTRISKVPSRKDGRS